MPCPPVTEHLLGPFPFSRLQSVREQVVVSRVVEYFQVEHEMDDLCWQRDGAVLPVLGYGVLDKDGLSGQTDVFQFEACHFCRAYEAVIQDIARQQHVRVLLEQIAMYLLQLVLLDDTPYLLLSAPSKAADAFGRVLGDVVVAQTEGGEGFQESQVIVTGKGGIVPCDVDLVQKQDTEILVELVDIGDGHFLLLVERFHIPEVGGIRLDCFLTVASVAQHLCKECAVPVYDFAEEHVCGAGLLLYPRVPADSQLFRYAVHEVLGILPPFLD